MIKHLAVHAGIVTILWAALTSTAENQITNHPIITVAAIGFFFHFIVGLINNV